MAFLTLTLLLFADAPTENLAKKMLPIYRKEIAEYTLAVEPAPKKKLELTKEPVFAWSNPVRQGLQQGVIFLWLRDGRPSALGCIFSEPEGMLKGGKVVHEFHALDIEKILVSRPIGVLYEWKPQTGLVRKELPDSGTPAAARGARLLQMRQLAKEFTGHSIDRDSQRWELQLLPTPLYRYPSAKNGLADGALFALVSSAGTDPEVLLLLEAKESRGTMRWEYACGRFSDLELRVRRRGKEVFSSIPSETNPFAHDPQHPYRIFPEKVVTLDGKLIARLRQTTNEGEVIIPVEEK